MPDSARSEGFGERLRFPPGVAESLGYYVYALRDPTRDGEVFYVGKGRGNRVYQHVNRALRVPGESEQTLRLDQIRAIQDQGQEVAVELIRYGLTDERVAFAIEAAVIDALRLAGVPLEANLVSGHGGEDGYGHNSEPVGDIVARYAAKPVEIPDDMNVLLIRLNRTRWGGGTDLLEKTRKWWRLGERRLRAEFAFTVYQGIVRAVFRIEGWEQPTAAHLEGNPQRVGRWAFRGSPDPEMESRFLFGDVRNYHGAPGSQNPVKYVHC